MFMICGVPGARFRELVLDLLFLSCHLDDRFSRAVSINQRREILGLERVLMSRFLSGCAEGHIYAAVVGQDEGVESFQSLLTIFLAQVGILLYHLFHLIAREV